MKTDEELRRLPIQNANTRIDFDKLITYRPESGLSPEIRSELPRLTRRMALCWQALEGFPTDALERGAVQELIAASRELDAKLDRVLVGQRKGLTQISARFRKALQELDIAPPQGDLDGVAE